ncbi:unnamed protein product, partial [Adineta ricciae]
YGDGTFATQIKYVTGSSARFTAITDLNNDKQLDLIVINLGEGTLVTMFGCSNLVFRKQTKLLTGNNSRSRAFVIDDFNNDNHIDVIVANSGTDNIGVFLGYGNFSFTNQKTYSTGLNSSPYSIAAGDFNNDTRLDVVTANFHSDSIAVFLGYAGGSFRNRTTYSTGSSSSPYSVSVGYFNNDTYLDIIVANYNNNKVGVFLGHGDGIFDIVMLYSMPYGSHPSSLVITDFNRNGKIDFAVINNGTDSLSIYLQTC